VLDLLNKLFTFETAYTDAPVQNQIAFQDPATPVMEAIIDLHNDVFFFLIVILTSVSWVMLRTLWKFNEKRHLRVVNFTHNTMLEIVWTVTPALILIVIAIPSFALLYSMDELIDPAITIKAIGHQWYWSYEYSDYRYNTINFDSYMIPEEDLEEGQLRLLEVDNRIIVPTDTHIRVLTTSTDVIHSWAVPSLGVKVDAVPGRLNQASMYIQREGVYYGQCSEICGVNHGFMPIVVQAVSTYDYLIWAYSKLF